MLGWPYSKKYYNFTKNNRKMIPNLVLFNLHMYVICCLLNLFETTKQKPKIEERATWKYVSDNWIALTYDNTYKWFSCLTIFCLFSNKWLHSAEKIIIVWVIKCISLKFNKNHVVISFYCRFFRLTCGLAMVDNIQHSW